MISPAPTAPHAFPEAASATAGEAAHGAPRRSIGTRLIVGLLTLLLLLLGFLAQTSCSTYGPQRPGEKVYRDVLFASPGGHRLYMDLYVPRSASTQPVPVVLWMFGGGWRVGSKGYHVNVRNLTSCGIAVASIQYRTSNVAVYPAQLDDCRSAAQWLRENGAQYGIDATRMGASGESSGGQLAAMLAVKEGKQRIRAVCALYTPTDLVELGWLYESRGKIRLIDKLLGGPMAEKTELATEASPLHYATAAMPPVMLIHGVHDHVVPVQQSERYFEALCEAGVETQLLEVPDRTHWFRLDNDLFAEVSVFFQRHLLRPGPPGKGKKAQGQASGKGEASAQAQAKAQPQAAEAKPKPQPQVETKS